MLPQFKGQESRSFRRDSWPFLSFNQKRMQLTADNKLKKLIIVGDRVLIRLKKPHEKTGSGLYLPPGVQEKEKVQQGYIIKAGPGYPIPMAMEDQEPWMETEEKTRYVPLQAKEGDLAIFLLNGAHEVVYNGSTFVLASWTLVLGKPP